MDRRHLFCFGLGYSAQVLAGRLLAEGWQVSGTCRSAERAEALVHQGITAHLFDDGQPLEHVAKALNGVTHLISSIPPGSDGDPVLAVHGNDLQAIGDDVSIGVCIRDFDENLFSPIELERAQ